jgi:cobaltochelatase CobS
MATRKELEQEILDIEEGINETPEEFRPRLKEVLNAKKAELASMQEDELKVSKTRKPRESKSSDNDAITAILATLNQYMQSSSGTGMDSESVRGMISEYLTKNKINLSDLDSSVLDEIKKNQTVILSIPSLSLKIEISKKYSNIPNLYPIIDDVLAGNNVYLIGEAGGGKTYAAEVVAKLLERQYSTINCSQYTSPTEIVGGQTIEGYREGKLIDAWKNGKVLILDEMPRLDPNTAGLFNDALAKSSKTKPSSEAKINSTNPKDPPIERNDKFALIATGNIYPNTPPPSKYKANNQQDLSLLDRFSGSVYFTAYSQIVDEDMSRYKFIYDMLVGNYYEYTQAIKDKKSPPEPKGLRTVLKANNLDELAVVSYRTIIAFRVAFEFELVRALAKMRSTEVGHANGKTLAMAFNSFLVAFAEDGKNTIIKSTGFTDSFINLKVAETIREIAKSPSSFLNTLTPEVAKNSKPIMDNVNSFLVADYFVPTTVN